jgi:hypothetical protein
MGEQHKLDYAHPPKSRKLIHPMIRVLVGILSLLFLTPTVDIIMGASNDGPISKAIGIVVTLSIALVLAFVSFTGRFRIRRT